MTTRHVEGFIADHAATMARLLETLPLRQESIRIFGRTIPTPRLTSWHGSAGYTFSGNTINAHPWTDELVAIRDRLSLLEGVEFNSVLVNYYRDGSDSVAFHADDEPELGPTDDDVRIASVSLGAPRRFVLKALEDGSRREWKLGAGALLVMGGTLQRTHVHAIPKTKRPVGPRMNLTFRVLR